MVSAPLKDPEKARAGRIGARARWGEQRVIRLDDLTTEQRRLVLALIEAAKEAPAATTASAQEVSSASSTTPTL